jgi:hypothetical protein
VSSAEMELRVMPTYFFHVGLVPKFGKPVYNVVIS